MARLFIGGTFREADKVEPVIEAATGDPLGDGSAATESEFDDAVAAARSALDGWRSTPACSTSSPGDRPPVRIWSSILAWTRWRSPVRRRRAG